jgi:hypothetical protein
MKDGTMTDTSTTRRPSRRYLMAIFAIATVIGLAVGGTFVATSDATPSTARSAGAPVPAATQTVTVAPSDYLCNGLHNKRHTDCVTLAARPAMVRTLDSGAVVTSPAGPSLVAQCLTHDSGKALDACLAQPPHKGMPADGSLCGGLTGADVTACHTLALRPAFDNGTISDPAGPALVTECRSDTSLSTDELSACLAQPTEG